jgi:hypothetical protein
MERPKNLEEFEISLRLSHPPARWPEGLRALWYDAKGNWEASHDIAQEMMTDNGSWIHAYLHRKEGDRYNAGYWYREAGKEFPAIDLEEELRELVGHFLENRP